MFDLRYHVASLAAVFLALIIGILVGVGISDRGLVDSAKTKFLQDEVASLQHRLDNQAKQSTDQARDRTASQTFINETYPALARNRLKGKQIAVVFVGSDKGGVGSSVSGALRDAGAEQVRLRALKVPIDAKQLDAALKGQPAAAGLRGKANLEALGRALGQELVVGGDTPLWDSLTGASSLVEHVAGGSKMPADGVVVVRTAAPQRGATSKFLLGVYEGLGSTGVACRRRRADGRGQLGDQGLPGRGSLDRRRRGHAGGPARAPAPARRPAGGPVRREELGDRRRPATAAAQARRGWLSRWSS